MRHKLSATYTLWQKIIVTILLFGLLIVTDVYGSILRSLPDLGFVNILFIFAFIFLCFKLVDFVLKERIVIEFDDDSLYIVDKKNEQEEHVPLRNLIRLNLRPVYFHIGNYWFNKHSLTFIDNLGQEQKIRFYVQTGKQNTQKFLSLVKSKNPDFRYKNWTHTFDFSH
jgi:hypothetical protein